MSNTTTTTTIPARMRRRLLDNAKQIRIDNWSNRPYDDPTRRAHAGKHGGMVTMLDEMERAGFIAESDLLALLDEADAIINDEGK